MIETIPTYEAMMPVVLNVLADGQPKSIRQVYSEVAISFGFSEEQLNLMVSSGKQSYVENRIGWAKTYLVKAGLIHQPRRAVCQLTKAGALALASKQVINNSYLRQFATFDDFTSTHPSSKAVSVDQTSSMNSLLQTHCENTQTPTEMIASAFHELNVALADELIELIHTLSPRFFEQLVVDLMLAMGYGGRQKDAGQATQYSSDGGIDGIIKEDKLGLESIYLQAKRYRDKTIGRPEIQAFAGALDMHHARKGVFITTSTFSKDAHHYVSRIEKRIVLIDGSELAALMIAHDVGVSTRTRYAVKAIDSDYFLDE
ncbi:MAG: restriction endonuclease [Vibrionaceae bacterium]